MKRRGFIQGIVGVLAAPALVRASSLDFIPPPQQAVMYNRTMFIDELIYIDQPTAIRNCRIVFSGGGSIISRSHLALTGCRLEMDDTWYGALVEMVGQAT